MLSRLVTRHRVMLRDEEVYRIAFELLDSVLEPGSAAYAAGPLGSGRLHYEVAAGLQKPREDLRAGNEQRLRQFAHGLRERLDVPVIDPGLLKVAGWSGSEHLAFYLQVLSRYGREAHFIDGWEYSTGATAEFMLCMKTGMPCFTADGARLPAQLGINMVKEAAGYLCSLGASPEPLQARASELASLPAALTV
jgi:hypothetical protein